MAITVNGKTRTLEAELSLRDLLQDLGMTKGRIAVEVNGNIVPRSQFSSQRISNLDSIEIVQAIGGG
ncbi:MAG: thiamine biosynthesis protein ThiS [Gammaproteobacteria bacterium TMED107]|nr:thiamine biosynthesis protein ThiS [Gammaproteobacteria bacterium]OUX77683.1 MAG: thiamine biosynthesis protein ThiS [Gammaproteobacteria bacterium TMED107]